MAFTGEENILTGTNSWTDIGEKLKPTDEIFFPNPECHGKISSAAIAPLNLDSKEFLSWKFERICQ